MHKILRRCLRKRWVVIIKTLYRSTERKRKGVQRRILTHVSTKLERMGCLPVTGWAERFSRYLEGKGDFTGQPSGTWSPQEWLRRSPGSNEGQRKDVIEGVDISILPIIPMCGKRRNGGSRCLVRNPVKKNEWKRFVSSAAWMAGNGVELSSDTWENARHLKPIVAHFPEKKAV